MGQNEDLADVTDRLGWELTSKGWLCPMHRSEYVLTLLEEQAREAHRWMDAMTTFDRAIEELSQGVLHPDGLLMIEQAGRARRAAFLKYMDSLKSYKDALVESRNQGEPAVSADYSNTPNGANAGTPGGEEPEEEQ